MNRVLDIETFVNKIGKAPWLFIAFFCAARFAAGGDFEPAAIPAIPNRASFNLSCVIALKRIYERSLQAQNLIPHRSFAQGPNTAEDVFNYYHETRSQQLPAGSEARTRVNGAVFIPNFELGEETNGAVRYSKEDPNASRILIFIPLRYRGTAVEYLIRVHELEHLISGWDNQIALETAAGEQDFVKLLNVQRAKFAIERATLRAEWEYLQLLPETTRQEMIGRIKADPVMGDRQKELFIDKFTRATQSFEDFLISQQRLHGYAGDQMVDHFEKMIVGVGHFPSHPPEERYYNVYKELPESKRRSLWERIQRDPLFEEDDRARLMAMVARFESIRKYDPSLDLRIKGNAKDIANGLSEKIDRWFRTNREFPNDLPHYDLWHLKLAPDIQGQSVHLRTIPNLPDPFVLAALNSLISKNAGLREIHLPPSVNANPPLEGELSVLLRQHGFVKTQTGDGLTYIFSEKDLPPWNHRYYEYVPVTFEHFPIIYRD